MKLNLKLSNQDKARLVILVILVVGFLLLAKVAYELFISHNDVGTLIEKYHYPPHLTHVTSVFEGKGLCELDSNPLTYEVRSIDIKIPEQFILKLQARKGIDFRATSKDEWLKAVPGQPFHGQVYDIDIHW